MHPHCERPAMPPAASTFAERACQLVSFALQRGREAGGAAVRREDDLADWIWQWQQSAPSSKQFLAVELSIILRALNGPNVAARVDENDCRQLCWVLARSMKHDS